MASDLPVTFRTDQPFDPAGWRPARTVYHSFAVDAQSMRHKTIPQRAYRIIHGSDVLWVLPDETTSGQLRSRTIRQALADTETWGRGDPLAYVAGCLARRGAGRLHWQEKT